MISGGGWWFMGAGPHDARDLAVRRERALERLAACSLASLEPIAFAVELDDFRAMDESVDEGSARLRELAW